MRMTLLDIGGTFIKCQDGRQIPIPSAGPREAIAASLRKAVNGWDSFNQAGGLGGTPHSPLGVQGDDCFASLSEASGAIPVSARIGISIPGPFDYKNGIFRAEHKFAAVKGESFRELAGLPAEADVRFIHDVCAVLEGSIRMLGLTDGNTAIVTLGTGLGFAVAQGGEVRYGPTLSPADCIWNLPLEDGILEDKVSGRGVRAIYSSLGGDATCTARDIAEMAFHGDRTAFEAYEQMGSILGKAIYPILDKLAVRNLLFAGQISQSLSLMEDGLRNHIGGLIRIAQAPDGAVFRGIETLFETNQ